MKNILSICLLCLAKLLGISGVILGFSIKYHTLAGKLLILDGVLLIIIVVLCVLNMRDQNKEDDQNKELISKMIKDGSLQQQLESYGFKLSKKLNV